MATLVLFVLWVRRGARALAPLGCTAALAALLIVDAQTPLPLPYAAAVTVGFVLLLASRIRRRAQVIDGTFLANLELGLLLTVGALALAVHLDGSLDGHTYPAVYVAICVLTAFSRPLASVSTVMLTAMLEAAIRIQGFGEASPLRVVPHFGHMLVFATLNVVVLRGEIARIRRASKSRLDAEITRVREDARTFRLLGAPDGSQAAPKPNDEDRLARSGVEEIHQSVLLALRLLRQSLGLHTAILLWQNDDATHLRISELVSDALEVSEGPFLVGDGILGAVIAQRSAISLSHLKPTYKLPYYGSPCPVRAVLALPVLDHGAMRGVLVVDRVMDRAFSVEEQTLVEEASRYAVRAIQNERVFVQLERAKVEQGKLYRAAESLGAATTETDVIEAGVKSAREIASVDFAAVTLYDESAKAHEIRAASGDEASKLVGQRFRTNNGLVSMVLQNRHSLPYRGEYDAQHQVVFTRRLMPPAMPSIVVLPLLVHDQPLGTLVLGSRRRGTFNDAARSTLEVLASHMAVSLSNARMLRRLEDLATMDGLTGLLNKRAMLEVAEQKITAAKRFGRRLSVLVTDIDHFKRVNDTYGHDVGDIVIKGLGEILRRAKRNTDAVARFGGEEFVVICEETDARGALLLAERVREELERTTFHPHGKDGSTLAVAVTCSIGVATYPDAGATWEDLFKAADEALYVSKRSGRNRSTVSAVSVRSPGSGASRSTAA